MPIPPASRHRPYRGRHRRRQAPPVPLVRAAIGALVLAAVVAGLPAAAPPGIVPGAVPLVVVPAAPAPVPVTKVFDAPRAALPDGLRDRVAEQDAGPVLAAHESGRTGPAIAAALDPPAPAPPATTPPDTVVATRDHVVALGPLDPGPDGLPPAVGRIGTLLRVPPEVVAALEVGDTVEVTADGVTEDRLVAEIDEENSDDVVESDAPTTLIAPSPDGWTLVRLA